ncbi:MAG: MATE family efflux transporter [Oscillospiraceae bacterium]|nr:MATE family efflux transporter [Oscillospiraceae bacterium]
MAEDRTQLDKYREMTETPVERLIIRLAIPSTISLLVTSIYNLADTYFVGQLGNSATGAVGIVYPLMTLIQAIGLMFGKGTGTLLGRQLGGKHNEEAEHTVAQGFIFSVLLGSALMIFGLLFINPLATLLGTTESMRPYTIVYARYILLAMPFKAAATCLSFSLRFQGYSSRATWGLACGAILNIILDPLLITGAGLGLAGAAIATMTGEMTSCLLLLWMCTRKGCVALRPRNMLPSLRSLVSICKNGFSSLIKNSLSSIATILLNTAAAPFGDAVVAAFTIVSRLVHIAQMIYFGISDGYQPVCSYNYGARCYERIRRGYWFCLKIGTLLIILVVLSFAFSRPIIAAFRDDAQVIAVGTRILRVQMLTLTLLPISSAGFVMLQGIGRNGPAAVLGSGRQGLFLVPLLLILPRIWGLNGLIAVQPSSDILAALLSALILRPNLRQLRQMEMEKLNSTTKES